MSASTYLVDILRGRDTGDGFKHLDTFRVEAERDDSAIDLAFAEARIKHPEVGDMTLSWVRPEDAKGGVIFGHVAHSPVGGWRVHLLEVRDAGPGAVDLAATCGGIEPWGRVDSSLTPQEWREWKAAQAPVKGWPEWADIERVDCPRCEAVYVKRRARALA
jgi:hypothetical protein